MAKKNDIFATINNMIANDTEISKRESIIRNNEIIIKDVFELKDDPDNEHISEDMTRENLSDLMLSILAIGLQNPILIKPNTNYIISGHRRRAACRLLVEDGHEEFRLIPCIERDSLKYNIKGLSKEQKEAYARIYNNVSQEELSPAKKMQAIKTLEEIYSAAKKAGDENFAKYSRSRNFIAKELKISEVSVSRLKSIDTKATDKVKEALEENIITQDTALSLTKEPEEVQNTIIENIINEVSNKAAEPKADYTFTKEDESEAVAEPKEPVTPPKLKESKIEVLKRADETKLNKIRNLISNLDSAEDVELDAVNALKVNQALDSIISNLKKVTDIIEK